MNIDRRRFLAGLATLPLIPACGDTAETQLPPPAPVNEIKIVAQTWGTSRVAAKIAELLIREQLSATASTELRPEADIWAPLSRGELHACVEVWPHRNAAGARAFLESGKVEAIGNRGTGRTAWFVPNYVVEANPEITAPTAKEGLQALLTKANVTELLTGPAEWVTPSPNRLAQLGVPTLRVQQQGSEEALVNQIRSAYEARTPFMASLWYPHPIHQVYNLQAVGLPAASGCSVDADDFGCDYNAEPLVKVAWPGLKFANRRVYTFLEAFSPAIDDIIGLLASADSIEVLAREWIRSRNLIWGPWVTAAKAIPTT